MSKINTRAEITAFLNAQGFSIEEDGSILIIRDEDGLNIFAAVDESQIEFMVDLCSINDLNSTNVEEIYEKILDQNTEILPTCFGIDSTESDDKRIVLVDSLALENLDTNELLLSLDSLAVNVITAHDLLALYLKSKS